MNAKQARSLKRGRACFGVHAKANVEHQQYDIPDVATQVIPRIRLREYATHFS